MQPPFRLISCINFFQVGLTDPYEAANGSSRFAKAVTCLNASPDEVIGSRTTVSQSKNQELVIIITYDFYSIMTIVDTKTINEIQLIIIVVVEPGS